jgi:hypothetical protein
VLFLKCCVARWTIVKKGIVLVLNVCFTTMSECLENKGKDSRPGSEKPMNTLTAAMKRT